MSTVPQISVDPALRRRGILRSLLRKPSVLLAALGLFIVSLIAIFGSLLAPFDPDFTVLDHVNAPPFTTDFILGGDRAGRDILSRLLVATATTIVGALIAVIVSLVAGVPAGLVAGYYSGWLDGISSWVANLLLALPGIVVLIAVYVVVGPSTVVSMSVVGLLFAPDYFRLVRNTVISVKNELYVDAARVAGVSDARIVARHIAVVVRAPIIIEMAFVGGLAIIIQAGLEFLGLGSPEDPTWGGMLQDAFAALYVAPAAILWPAAAITLTVLAFLLIANGVRDVLAEGGADGPVERRHPMVSVIPPGPQEPPPGSVLVVSHLSVAYGLASGTSREVVHDVGLNVMAAEVLGLVGESGSGKTQTALAILGLVPPQADVSGSVRLEGVELLDLPARAFNKLRGSRIAYVPQEPMSNLDPSFTVLQQFGFAMKGKVVRSRAETRARALQLLERVEVPDPPRVLDLYPHQLSGGMAQRVLIAIAVSCDPMLLIADEPTTALDVTVQAEVLQLLRGLQQETNMAMLLVTHDLGVVADICDRVAVMSEGCIVECAPVESVLSAPTHPYTRGLIAAAKDETAVRIYDEGGTRC